MRKLKALCLMGMFLAVGACQDLDVPNINDPDRTRAIGDPRDVESLVGGTFLEYWSNTQKPSPAMVLTTLGDEGTASWGNWGMQDLSSEPRKAFQNSQSYGYRTFAEAPWYGMYRVLSNANDGLQQIAGGLKIVDDDGKDQTIRTQAFAKFMQGMALGYLGLFFDKAFVYTEDINLETDELSLKPYPDVIAAAVKSLEDAVALSSTPFTLPNNWVNGVDLTNGDLQRLAHTSIARLLTAGARSPQERDAADWSKVVSHIAQGVQKDYFVQGDGEFWWAYNFYTSHHVWTRSDYMLIGPSDKSGAFAQWLATPVANRQPFDIVTDDRRITGAAGAKAAGKYFKYYGAPRHRPDRGTYHFSFYNQTRWIDHLLSGATGPMPWMLRAEMDLLKAEALIRTGDNAGAVALINKTRVANGELPALTGAESKADLMAYMKYEKRLETMQSFSGLAYYDYRGWRTIPGPGITGAPITMPTGTLLHAPIPAKELEILKQEIYTFGGEGKTGSAMIVPTREHRFSTASQQVQQ